MQKLQVLVPSFWEKFNCIGSACEENCCEADWGIFIDKNTYNLYRGIKDPEFQEQMKSRIKRVRTEKANDKTYAQMLLDDQGKCMWLENGMCAIQLKLGYKYLCSTCLLYPRKQIKNFFGVLESTLSMSCPEVVRVGCFPDQEITYKVIELENTHSRSLAAQPVVGFDKKTNPLAVHAPVLRRCCTVIMQNRELSIADRIFAIGVMLKKIRDYSDVGNFDIAPAVAEQYVAAVQGGQFNNILSTFSDNPEVKATIKAKIFNTAISLEKSGKPSFKSFIPCIENLATKLDKAPENVTNLEVSTMIETAASKYWGEFLEKRGHIIENYFVNYIFGTSFPFSYPIGIQHHVLLLAESYALLKLLICSTADIDGYITDENLITAITSLFRHTGHSDKIKGLTESYMVTGMDSMACISFMLRD
ncbi:MAG: flagellin lysine-N-methylase [Oscillospiraceae bacterium]|nr:flagellin lysine-N-methylase [Oscillospiraceae bacterium]